MAFFVDLKISLNSKYHCLIEYVIINHLVQCQWIHATFLRSEFKEWLFWYNR